MPVRPRTRVARTRTAPSAPAMVATSAPVFTGSRGVRRERMTKLRARIAERLVMAKNTAAMLTTFNECDMSEVMRLRAEHKEAFEKRHGTGLGFMGFFMKAVVSALEKYPRVNASIVGDEIEYHDYIDVSVAVGTDKGLVVPVVRNVQGMSIAQIEMGIKELAVKARDGRLSVEDMTGGTFTITNGGVYGSLMSTPILNPPQSGILGMHAIKNRAVECPKNPGACRHPTHDVPRAQLRPPHRGRRRGGGLPGAGEERHREARAAAARSVKSSDRA